MKSRLSPRPALSLVTLLIVGLLVVQLASGGQEPEHSGTGEAATAAATITVRTDRADAVYRQGETVRFEVRLLRDGQPVVGETFQYRLNMDSVGDLGSGTLESKAEAVIIEGTLDRPGFLHCEVTVAGPGKAVRARAGAAVDPSLILPTMPPPDEFDTFWQARRELVRSTPLEPRLTPVELPEAPEGYEGFDLTLDCPGSERPVSGIFARPVGAPPRSLPAILFVHGAGVNPAGRGLPLRGARVPALGLEINAHGLPNDQPAAFYKELAQGPMKGYPLHHADDAERVVFHGMFLRLMRAMEFLATQEEWDGRTLCVIGSSQGGAQAIAAAGLDERVTFIAAAVPGLCDLTGPVQGRISGWPKFLKPGEADRPDVLRTCRLYDATNFAQRTMAEGAFSVGYIDTATPPTSIYALYNTWRGPKELFAEPLMGHRTDAEMYNRLFAKLTAHIASRQ